MNTARTVRFACIAISILLISAAAVAAAEASDSATSGSLRILSCNIRLPMPEDEKSGDGWPARRELCAETIRAQRADIICLQECRGFQLEYLKGGMPEYDSHALSNPEPEFFPANAILYSRTRFEAVSAGGFWLSETPHIAGTMSWDSARPRFANWVQLKDRQSGCEFRVWNTHLDHIGQTAREQQAQMMTEAAAVFGDAYPQLLAGDFNADASNPAAAKLTAAGWTDTYMAVHGNDPGFTYHAFKGAEYPKVKPAASRKGKIDWIMLRGPVKPLAAAVIRDARDGRYPSDHYFMSADVALCAADQATTRPQ